MSRKKRRTPRPGPLPDPGELHPTLDLHGHTAEEARRRAERWLREMREEGMLLVRVITGRGRRSLGPPVLRGEIEELLRDLRGSVVASHSLDPSGGALRVELRRPKRPPAPRTGAPRAPALPSDPDLLRRAEESLWELGIQPTPALLEAEVRRLLRAGEDS